MQVLLDYDEQWVTVKVPPPCDHVFVMTNVFQHQPRFIMPPSFAMSVLRDAFEVPENHSRYLRKGAHAGEVSLLPFQSSQGWRLDPKTWKEDHSYGLATHRIYYSVVLAVMLNGFIKPQQVLLPHQVDQGTIDILVEDNPTLDSIYVFPYDSQHRVTLRREDVAHAA